MHKVDTVQKKYTELLADQRRLDKENAKNKKRADLFQKEKDQVRSDLTKTTTVKDKLEKLCRELQKENKKLKVSIGTYAAPYLSMLKHFPQDEHRRIEDNEKASRDELSDRTEGLFLEIEDLIQKQQNPGVPRQGLEMEEMSVAPNSHAFVWLVTDGESRFRSKFKSLVDQYELREHHFYSLLRIKEAEVNLEKAKAEEQRKKSDAEATKSRTLTTQVSTFSQTETELRNQLNIYVEKFKQVCGHAFFFVCFRIAACDTSRLLLHKYLLLTSLLESRKPYWLRY